MQPWSKQYRPANEHYSATSSTTKLLYFHLITHWNMNWMMTGQTFSPPHRPHFTKAYSAQHSHYTQLWVLTAPGLGSTLWNKLPSFLLSAVQNVPFLHNVAKSIRNGIHTAMATFGDSFQQVWFSSVSFKETFVLSARRDAQDITRSIWPVILEFVCF